MNIMKYQSVERRSWFWLGFIQNVSQCFINSFTMIKFFMKSWFWMESFIDSIKLLAFNTSIATNLFCYCKVWEIGVESFLGFEICFLQFSLIWASQETAACFFSPIYCNVGNSPQGLKFMDYCEKYIVFNHLFALV